VTLSQPFRRALLVIAAALLLGLAWTGLSGGANQLSQSQSVGQLAQTFTQLAFGLFALLSVVTTFWARRWGLWMLAGWVVSVTLAAGLASVVWGGTSVAIGLLAGGAALLISSAIAWMLRAGGWP
jgi:hypothetical protein